MIEGLKLKVTADELRRHCEERASYHNRRADEKEAELPALKEALERIKSPTAAAPSLAQMSKTGYAVDDPAGDLERDIRDHRNKAQVFRFFGEHLFDEDYTLMERDLTRLDILKG